MICGIPTLMEFSDADALSGFCAEQGFRFVEMNTTFPWFQLRHLTADMVRTLNRKYGVGFTVHLHDQVNPFEFSPDLRYGCLNHILWAMQLARELDLPRITMHLLPGTYSSINGVKTYLYAHCQDTYLGYVQAFRDLAEKELAGCSTVFCIENTSGFQPFHRQAIHDCDVKANHLGFGDGQLDVARYLKLAKELNATVVAEVKESGALIRSKNYMIRNGYWSMPDTGIPKNRPSGGEAEK